VDLFGIALCSRSHPGPGVQPEPHGVANAVKQTNFAIMQGVHGVLLAGLSAGERQHA
jgi:hypothetical protein